MKIKNKISQLLIIGALILPTLEGCKKYPEGPMISIKSRTERVANTWQVDNYKINSNDYTSLVSGYTETYTKDGNYFYSFGNFAGNGKWAFQNDDKELFVSGVSNKSSETYYILKLEENQFWYYYMKGNDRHELHLITN